MKQEKKRLSLKSYLKDPFVYIAVISFLFLLLEWFVLWKSPKVAGADFTIYYDAANQFKRNASSLYDDFYLYLYPPPSILIFVVFTALPLGLSFFLFVCLMYLCLIAAFHLWRHAAGERETFEIGPRRNIQFMLFAMASAPVYHNISLGQINSLVLLFGVLYVYFLKRRPILAGIMLSIAIWVKVYPVFLLMLGLLSKEGRRSIISCVASCVLIPAILLPWMPLHLYWDFVAKIGRESQTTSGHMINQSLSAFFIRFHIPFEDIFQWPNIHAVPVWFKALNYLLLFSTILAGFVQTLRNKFRKEQNQIVYAAILLSLGAVFSPIGWGHTYVFALPLFIVGFETIRTYFNKPWAIATAIVMALLLLIPVHSVQPIINKLPVIIKNVYYSRILWVTIAFILLLLWSMNKPVKNESSDKA